MIRRAGPADAAAMAALHATIFDAPWNAGDIAGLIEGPAGAGFVDVVSADAQSVTRSSSGTVSGFIIGRIAVDEGEILTVGVAVTGRRRGLGRALVTAFITWARQSGARRLFLEVAADNDAALALYRGLGFVGVGRRRGYYVHPGRAAVDAECMGLDL